MFIRFASSKVLSIVGYIHWPVNGIYSNADPIIKSISMFSHKLIQKKVNSRTREDIQSAKIEEKALNKFHNPSQSEDYCESKKKAKKKAKRNAEREKRKFENIAISNDQSKSSNKVKDDDHIKFSEEEFPLKENDEKGNINWNINTDLKKSKFKRYFHAEVIDSTGNSSINDNSTDDIDDNSSSAFQKPVKKKKHKHDKQNSFYKESKSVNETLKSKPDKSFLFTFEDSSSSGGEEEVFEPWVTSSDNTPHKSAKPNEKLDRNSMINSHNKYNSSNKIQQQDNVVEMSPEQVDNVVEIPQEQLTNIETPYKSRHQQKMELLAAEKEQRFIDKRTIVGRVLAEEKISDEKLAIALLPGKRIYFNGTVVVTPLLGSVNVLGYTIGVGSSQMVSSPDSQALLGLLPQDCQQITKSVREQLIAAGLSQQFTKQLQGHKKAATVLLLSRCDVPSINFLRTLGCQNMSLPFAQGEWADVLDAELITQNNCKYYTLLEESHQWMAIIDKLCMDYKLGKGLKVLICGGQRAGKSTLFRYVINSLLNSACSIDNVNCLDLDPGQPEFSLPTTLSCTTVSQPLLEPPFLHQIPKDNMKAVVLGTTSTMYVVEEYISCLKSLVSNNKENGIPLVINTMGWTNGMGLDLMLDAIRIIKPSHVIQIHNPQDARNNFEVQLSSDYVLSSQGGMITKSGTQDDMNYDMLEVTAVNRYPVSKKPLRASTLRDFKVFSEFSHLLENEEKVEMSVDVRVPWSAMALHVCGRQVPKENILQVLNASLVALCHISPSMIVEPPRPDLPKQLILEELRTHPAECRGWAMVRGIDPLTQHIHLCTNLSEKEVLENVNAIIMTQLYLPQELYMYYSQGDGPYIQNIKRTGAGVSTLRRRIMPRANSKQIANFAEKQSLSHQSTPPHKREFSSERKKSTERKKSKTLNKSVPLENSDVVKDKDYYESSWT